LAEYRNILSPTTLTLYYSLLYLLLIDIGTLTVLSTMPWLLKIALTSLYDFPYINSWAVGTQMLTSFYPLISNTTLLLYVKPYRRAIVRLVRGGRGIAQRIQAIETLRSTNGGMASLGRRSYNL